MQRSPRVSASTPSPKKMADPQEKADCVRVAVRVRPLNNREKSIATNARFSWKIDESSITQCDNGKLLASNSYSFDTVFMQESTNEQIFVKLAQPVVTSAVQGMNGVIFAYGQTAAGKTYTMLGTESDPGVTRRAIAAVFEAVAREQKRQFLLRASYIEIYNEAIRDLLLPSNDNLKIHEDVFNKRVFVDSREEVVTSVDEVMGIIEAGEQARAVGVTNMNDRSSRSHTIFTLKIESREMEDTPENDTLAIQNNGVAVRASTLSLVDLAGSERASFTKAQGMRLVEGGHINKSLLTLGTVINKLSSGVTQMHIPYRDSKLTRLLQPALGGNARTCIICAVTPAVLHMDETISTLKFASRAKKVTNLAKTNEFLDDRAKLRKAEKQIALLKSELDKATKGGACTGCETGDGGTVRDDSMRVAEFSKRFETLVKHITTTSSSRISCSPTRVGNASPRTISKKHPKTPTLTSALDLQRPLTRNNSHKRKRDDEADDSESDAMHAMRQKVMQAEQSKRAALYEIEYEREVMRREVELLAAASEEASMGRICAERECADAMSALASAEARSLVDEMISEAVTKSLATRELRSAKCEIEGLKQVEGENEGLRVEIKTLKKSNVELIRRDKRGVGPVLKELNAVKSKLGECEGKIRGLKQMGSKKESERAGLERAVKEKEREIKRVNGELEKRRRQTEKSRERVKMEIEKAVLEERKKLEGETEKLKLGWEKEKEEFMKEIVREQAVVQEKENELETEREKCSGLETQLDELRRERDGLREEMQGVSTQCETLEGEKTGLAEEVAQKWLELNECRSELTHGRERIESLESTNSSLETLKESLQEQLAQLQEALSAAKGESQEAREHMQLLARKLAVQQQETLQLRVATESATKAAKRLEVKCVKLQTELDCARGACENCEFSARSLNKAVQEREETLEKLVRCEEERRKMGRESAKLMEETSTRTREVLRLSERLRVRDESIYEMEREYGSMKRDEVVRRLEEMVRGKDVEIRTLKRMRDTGMDGDAEEVRVQREVAVAEKKRLEKKVRRLEDEVERSQAEAFRLRDRIKQGDAARVRRRVQQQEAALQSMQQTMMNANEQQLQHVDHNKQQQRDVLRTVPPHNNNDNNNNNR